MNARAELRLSKDQFLAWAETVPDTRIEWVDGEVVMMVSVRRVHSIIVGNAMAALFRRLSREAWIVHSGQFGVDLDRSIRIPDVFVETAGKDGKAIFGDDAVLIIEVLSPGSIKADMIQKPREYAGLKSLEAYLVLSTDEKCAYLWQRLANGDFPDDPLEGTSGTVDVATLGVSIPLDEFYLGTGLS
jgi:Uma2 family endonuclease